MDENETLQDQKDLAEEISATLSGSAASFSTALRAGLKNAVAEGHSLERVLKQAALSISGSALSAGVKPLADLVAGGASSVLGGLGGGAVKALSQSASIGSASLQAQVNAATKMVPFAEGGVIGSPTAFGLPGGRVGLMGEAGREAVLPLARGSDGRLGVALEGAAGGGTNVTVNINATDAQSFQRSEAQVSAMLARAVARGRRAL